MVDVVVFCPMTDRSAASQALRFWWLALRPYLRRMTFSASPFAASLSVSLTGVSLSCLLLMSLCVLKLRGGLGLKLI